jgi:hypothetical protein
LIERVIDYLEYRYSRVTALDCFRCGSQFTHSYSAVQTRWHLGKNKCKGGSFGTWATNITQHFVLKDELLSVLLNKLESSDRGEQDYVLQFFSDVFGELTESPSFR